MSPRNPVSSVRPRRRGCGLARGPQAANGAYEIYRGSQPGFIPGPATLLATVFAPQATYTDVAAAGNPTANRYYVVRLKCGGFWGMRIERARSALS